MDEYERYERGPALADTNRDLPCVVCGTNLRGRRLDQRCPRCDAPVGLAAEGDLLRYADHRWLSRLRRGATALTIAFAATPVMTMAAQLWLEHAVDQPGGAAVFVIAMCAVAPGVAFFLHGIRRITSAEPEPGQLRARRGWLQWLVRGSAVGGMVGAVLIVVHSASTSRQMMWTGYAGYALLLLWAPAIAGMSCVLLGLARRMESPAMRAATWLSTAVMILTLLAAVGANLAMLRKEQSVAAICSLTAAVFVYSIFGSALLAIYVSAITAEQRRARRLARG